MKKRKRTNSVHASHGTVLIEACSSLGIILFIIIGGICLVLACFQMLALNHALGVASRYAILNRPAVSIKDKLIKTGRSYGVTIDPAAVKICPLTDLNCGTDSIGVPGSDFRISAIIPVRILPSYEIDYSSSIVAVSEKPF